MKAMNVQPVIDKIKATVESHRIDDGAYSRYLWQNDDSTRKMGANEYGCADAANILYTIGSFERDPQKREKLIETLRGFQHPDGLFDEGTHHPQHCTAHCTAALELFDALPRSPLTALEKYRDVGELYRLLESLAWIDEPWPAAHVGAGIYASFILTGNASPDWQNAYFGWLTEHADPKYGIGYSGGIDAGVRPLSHHLNGWFHYLFNFVFARRPIPYAEKLVDSCLSLYENKTGLVGNFGHQINFAEVDWIFALHRASAQTGYRVAEAKEQLRDFAEGYFDYLLALDAGSDDRWNDLHLLFGCVCAVAELQLALPGEILTDYPLKSVLDRRPFI